MAIAKIELVAPSIFGRFGDLAASVIQYVINIAAYKMVKAYGPFEMLEMQRSAAKCSEVLAKCW